MTCVLPWLATVLIAFSDQAPAPAAKAPTDVIRASNVRITRILRPGHTVTAADRDEVSRILAEVTDFDRVAERVLGPRWAEMPPPEQVAFVAAFARLVAATAIAKMGRYRADRFEYLSETIEDDRASVSTRAYFQGKGVSLEYDMARTDGRWRIVNYSLNGVDNARSYRRQFDKILETDTVAVLIERLRAKTAELETGGAS